MNIDVKISKQFLIFLALAAAADVFLWFSIIAKNSDILEVYFLNVGQGDSQFVNLPGGAQVLVDGGPHGRVVRELAKVLPPLDRYLDLVILSHADLDHLSGLLEVFNRYEVGAFIFSGRGADTKEWREFANILNAKKVPVIVVGEGDKLKYNGSILTFLSPGPEFLQSGAANEAALVSLLESKNAKIIFTSDIDFAVEDHLLKKYDLDADILKVAHHGSRFGTSEEFLKEATPKIAVIQVGENNYGHPTKQTLGRLADVGASVYRNDFDGTVKLEIDGAGVRVFKGI